MEQNHEPITTIYTRNLQLSERIEEYVNKKSEKFIRHLPSLDEVRVDLSHNKTARDANDRYVAQVTIRGKKMLLRAEERADDLHAAFDKTVEIMDRQIRKYKGKKYNKNRGKSPLPDEFIALNVEEDYLEQEPEIVRRKGFTVYPMDEIEAIEQMELLGHENFFIFYNANTSNINVLYKRRDGRFGLLEPEIG